MKHIHGGNVCQYRNCMDFSANCNPLGTPESIRAAAAEALSHISEYPEVGCAALKRAIADYEGTDADQVICGNGAAELIFTLCHAKKPRRALLPAPTFAEYEQALQSVECRCEHFFLQEKENFALDAGEEGERFLARLREGFDLVFLCNPNNPTGMLTSRKFLTEVLKECEKQGTFLVIDECFLDFVREPEAYTMKEFLRKSPNLFLLKAFTKRYAMAGIRLGYGLCGNRKMLERMDEMTQPWNISTIAQAAGLAALKEVEYVEAGRELVFREAAFLRERMEALGIRLYPSAASYLFFREREDLFAECVKRGVLIRDCSNYPGLTKGYFRIAVRRHEENCRLLAVLEEIRRS